MRRFVTLAFVFTAAVPTLFGGLAFAAPTPMPGGSNQLNAVSGKLGTTLFNGTIRLKVLELRDATAGEAASMTPAADKKVMVMSVLIHNGLSTNFGELLDYTLADKDDVSFLVPSINITPNPLNILQAAAAKQRALFIVDKSFAPTKLIVSCPTCNATLHYRAFRIQLPATPVPAAS